MFNKYFIKIFIILILFLNILYAGKRYLKTITHPKFGQIMAGELIVRYSANSPGQTIKKSISKNFAIKKSIHITNNTELYQLSNNDDFDSMYSILKSNINVELVQPNFVYKSQSLKYPNDPDYDTGISAKQWGLAKIQCDSAWEIESGKNSNIIIAVLDTGIDTDHPDLKNKIYVNQTELNGIKGIDDDGNGYIDDIQGFNFLWAKQVKGSSTSYPQDDVWQADTTFPQMFDIDGHGSWTSGIIAAENDNGTFGVGIDWGSSILPVRVLGADASGTYLISNTYLSTWGIYYAVKMNAKIINMSLGSYSYDSLFLEAINYAYNKGVVVIAAAGNDNNNNDNNPVYPASYDNVISVGASDISDYRTDFSNYGWNTNLFAPGKNIYGPNNLGGIQYGDGTSASAPFVSGVAALILTHNPDLKPHEVKDILVKSGDNIIKIGSINGTFPRLNALNALRMTQLKYAVTDYDKAVVVNVPNPFRLNSQPGYMEFRPVKNTSTLSVKIYSINGEFIKQLNGPNEIVDTVYSNGATSKIGRWYGDSIRNTKVPPGTYLFFTRTDNGTYREKLTVINW